ncbi:MAG: ATP-binding protein [Elusimicrobiales bacterium]|nr:ATP-binding protein [Elusimicrobiales bacterium]
MRKVLVKAAVILLLSETAVMALLWYSGIAHSPIGIILDPLLMALVALAPIYFLLRAERKAMARRELLDAKLHRIVDGLWSASLHTLSETELLSTILKEILDNSPISTVRKGAIFLAEGELLVLKTEQGFSEEQKRMCGEVGSGRCLCGRVLENGEPVFASEVDDRHDNEFPDMEPHGHYCFPIKSAGRVVGELNLYLEAGHARDAAEERFLSSVCAIIARILEGKKLERSLFRMQKTEALNRFAAGIAHDLNNILGAIRGFSEVAGRCLPKGSETADDMREISSAVDRGESLTRRLKLFARQETEKPEVFDLNATVNGLGGMLRRLMGGVSVELKTSGQPLQVKAVRGQLEQVLMNLAANARDAMPGKGVFSVETIAQEICFTASRRCLKAAKLTVSDTGSGMTEEQLEKVFEPFYTTKGREEGSGLGLAVVQGIVQQHGGEIFTRSAPGKGTAFDIYLPLAD